MVTCNYKGGWKIQFTVFTVQEEKEMSFDDTWQRMKMLFRIIVETVPISSLFKLHIICTYSHLFLF